MQTLKTIALAPTAACLLIGCHADVYTEDLGHYLSMSEFSQIYQAGYFYGPHTYTIATHRKWIEENAIFYGGAFRLPVDWSFGYGNCAPLSDEPSADGDETVYVLQGRPGDNTRSLTIAYIAMMENEAIQQDCGEALEFIDHAAAQRMFQYP
jgi:hypothetical protein